MKTNVLWSTVGLFVAVALVLISCGPKASPAPEASAPVLTPSAPATPTSPVSVPTLAPAEKPKYGGILNILQPTFNEVFSPAIASGPGDLGGYVYEQFTNYDWSRGKAGTGENDYGVGATTFDFVSGYLAEKWQTPETGVWVLDIRKGVHWALDPNSEASRLMNGREFTADDAMWSINFIKSTPTTTFVISQPVVAKNLTVEKTGPSQITIRTPVDPATTYLWITGGGQGQFLWPPEVLQKYGTTMNWQQTVGTGPYVLTDYVSQSVITLKRNPNYWQKDPVGAGKGNQLPYPDGVKILIVPDTSTRLAAIRTSRADWVSRVQWEDAQSLIRTTPRLQYYKALQGGSDALVVGMKTEKADLPFKDVRVRQALTMAIDFEAMKKDLYQGEAEILTVPVSLAYPNLYTPMEKLPASVQALYKYNPEGAKKLLAEAGYPNGFKTKIVVQNISTQTDLAAVLKAMWAKVGVDLEIQPREFAVYNANSNARSWEEMMLRTTSQMDRLHTRYAFSGYRGPSRANPSFINEPIGKDPVIEAAYQEIQRNIEINYPKADQLIKDLIPHILEQAYIIAPPAPYSYQLWQPWVKNYHGELKSGGGGLGVSVWIPYVWIDQDLKEQMIGRR